MCKCFHALALLDASMHWLHLMLPCTGFIWCFHALALFDASMHWLYLMLPCTGIIWLLHHSFMIPFHFVYLFKSTSFHWFSHVHSANLYFYGKKLVACREEDLKKKVHYFVLRIVRSRELCESRGGRPGLPVPNIPYGLCGRKATLEKKKEKKKKKKNRNQRKAKQSSGAVWKSRWPSWLPVPSRSLWSLWT